MAGMSSTLNMIKHSIYSFISGLTVEPASFLMFITVTSTQAAYPTWMKDKCTAMYMDEVPMTASKVDFDDHIQSHVVIWGNIMNLSYTPLRLLALPLAGAIADKYGRTATICIGFLCVSVEKLSELIVFSSSVNAPLWIYVAGGVLISFMGTFSQAFIASQSFMVDTSVTPQAASMKMTRLSLFRSLGSMVGLFGATLLMKPLGTMMWTAVAMFGSTFAFILVLWRVPMVRPMALQDELHKAHGDHREPTDVEVADVIDGPISAVCYIGRLYKSIWAVLAKRRSRIVTILIWLGVLQVALAVLSSNEALALLHTYVTFEPLLWDAEQLALFTLVTNIIMIVGLVVGTYFLQGTLKLRNSTVLMIATTSQIFSILPVSFATESWIMYLYSAFGIFGGLLIPVSMAYFSEHLQAKEMGVFISGIYLLVEVVIVSGMFAFTPLYIATMHTFRGTVFVIGAVLTLFALVVLIFIKRYERRHTVAMVKHVVVVDERSSS